MSIPSTAQTLLSRAVDYDQKKRLVEAKVCYLEGISLLLERLKVETQVELKHRIQEKAAEYLKRAEDIQRVIFEQKRNGTYHEQFKIENNSTGNSYETLFGRFLNQDGDVLYVKVEDPYIRSYHQCQNFLRLCELLVKRCKVMTKIVLLTTSNEQQSKNHPQSQIYLLTEIKRSLMTHGVELVIQFSDTLHDRQITLSTGWVIKIGRGLDYFKPPEEKIILGLHDLDLRPCSETNVDIYHTKNIDYNS